MSTDLQKLYQTVRETGELNHKQTVTSVSKSTGLDEATVIRTLARAKREDDRDRKRRAKKGNYGISA